MEEFQKLNGRKKLDKMPFFGNVYNGLLKGNKCILNKEISMLNESGSIMIESKRATVMENKGNVYVCHLEGLNKNVIAHDSSPK